MFTDRRVLFAIAALVAVGTADAPASPIHRCHQRGCTAHESLRSDFDGPHRWLFFGPGYVFEPGKGILGGPCGLPSSGCTDMVN